MYLGDISEVSDISGLGKGKGKKRLKKIAKIAAAATAFYFAPTLATAIARQVAQQKQQKKMMAAAAPMYEAPTSSGFTATESSPAISPMVEPQPSVSAGFTTLAPSSLTSPTIEPQSSVPPAAAAAPAKPVKESPFKKFPWLLPALVGGVLLYTMKR